MADQPRSHKTSGRPDREPTAGIPRWVWVSAIAAALVVLLVVIMILLFPGSGGTHGPGRHASSGEQAPPSPDPEMDERAAPVMPFDLDATTHSFADTSDGAVEQVVVNSPTDTAWFARQRADHSMPGMGMGN